MSFLSCSSLLFWIYFRDTLSQSNFLLGQECHPKANIFSTRCKFCLRSPSPLATEPTTPETNGGNYDVLGHPWTFANLPCSALGYLELRLSNRSGNSLWRMANHQNSRFKNLPSAVCPCLLCPDSSAIVILAASLLGDRFQQPMWFPQASWGVGAGQRISAVRWGWPRALSSPGSSPSRPPGSSQIRLSALSFRSPQF